MIDPNTCEAPTDARHLAETLAPTICKACDDRLSGLSWFRTDWQRGGAGTARGVFRDDDDVERDVVLKVPVGRRELTWLRRLQSADGVTPALFASDDSCGGYDLAWVVIEYFQHGPLGAHWQSEHMPLLADAAAHFHLAASRYPVDEPVQVELWDELLASARENVKRNDLPGRADWNKSLKSASRRLGELFNEWNHRDATHWLHGDLHPANAMSRSPLGEGPISLIDLAEVRAGHWVEDAVFLERQFWSRRDLLKSLRPVTTIARARKAVGLPVEPEYPRLAMLRRVLLAATAPAFLRSEGSPAHLESCLHWLHIGLAELK